MMMPANYSVIAENEMTYVNGGASFIDAIGAVTAPIWNLDNVKAFSTNVVTLIGNAFIGDTIHNTLGKIFEAGASFDSIGAGFKSIFVAKDAKGNVHYGESIAKTLGAAAAIYNLGRTEVKNTAGDVKLFASKPSAKYTLKDKNGDTFVTIW